MSRFSKSAAFPILIVVILAFFAQQLISSPNKKKDPGFGTFSQQLDTGAIKSVEMRNRSNELLVTLRNDKGQYEIGFATEFGDELTKHAGRRRAEQEDRSPSTSRAPARTGGSRCSPTSCRSCCSSASGSSS